MKKLLLAAVLISVGQAAQAAQSIQGPVIVIDADTVEVSGMRIRLKGVDAPELSHPSGIEAKRAMQTIAGTWLTCTLTGEKTHGREVGWCSNSTGEDINAAIILAGKALACPRFDARYLKFEQPGAIARLPRAPYCRVQP